MKSSLLIRVATPTVAIGLLVLAVALLGAWHVGRTQTAMSDMLRENVPSLNASKQMILALRQLRFHSFLYVLDPDPDRLREVEKDERAFATAFRQARNYAFTPEEKAYLKELEEGYQRYQHDLTNRRTSAAKLTGSEAAKIAASHPVRHLIKPCQDYFDLNEGLMERAVAENEQVSRQVRLGFILLAVLGPAGGLLAGYGFARNLERQERRHLEDLMRAEQLSAAGQLAASVAHEIRNPLTSIKVLVDLALRDHNPRPLTHVNLEVVQHEIARMEQTVQGFLDFARPPSLKKQQCDLGALAGQAVALVQPRARQQHVSVSLDRPEQPLLGCVDAGQFCHVLVNLFLNALDAMPQGGRLEARLHTSPRGETVLTVADTGQGILPEMLPRLFTPFASSKATGSGLGLCISRRIVEEHGGRISGGNQAGGGARFVITLPQEANGTPHAKLADH